MPTPLPHWGDGLFARLGCFHPTALGGEGPTAGRRARRRITTKCIVDPCGQCGYCTVAARRGRKRCDSTGRNEKGQRCDATRRNDRGKRCDATRRNDRRHKSPTLGSCGHTCTSIFRRLGQVHSGFCVTLQSTDDMPTHSPRQKRYQCVPSSRQVHRLRGNSRSI